MWTDHIVEEVRRRREEYAAEHNHDLRAIWRAARERQERDGATVVSHPPRGAATDDICDQRRGG